MFGPRAGAFATACLVMLSPCLFAQTPVSQPAVKTLSPDELAQLRPTRIRASQDPETLKAHGSQRAEIEFAEDRIAVERFGLLLTRCWIDGETGLYIRPRGCLTMVGADIESDAYNKRVRELIAERGLPPGAAKTLERYRKSQAFRKKQPDLKWVTLPGPKWEGQPPKDPLGPFIVGAFQLYVLPNQTIDLRSEADALRVVRNWSPDDRQKYVPQEPLREYQKNPLDVVIARRDREIGQTYFDPEEEFAVAEWPELELLVLREGGASPDHTFFDVASGRVMWTWMPSLERTLQELRESRSKGSPTSQPASDG